MASAQAKKNRADPLLAEWQGRSSGRYSCGASQFASVVYPKCGKV